MTTENTKTKKLMERQNYTKKAFTFHMDFSVV